MTNICRQNQLVKPFNKYITVNSHFYKIVFKRSSSCCFNGTEATSTRVQNWSDVLSVFSVKTSTGESSADVAELDNNRISIIKTIFADMNTVTSKTEEITDADNNTIAKLTIEITSKNYTDIILQYNFNTEQQEMLRELMSDENRKS